MRALALLAAALLLAGCVNPLAPEDDLQTASTEDAGAEAAPPADEAGATDAPAPSDPAPASEPASSASAPSANVAPPPSAPVAPAPPAPPEKKAWNLTEEARVGYAAALGGPEVPTQGRGDADHCADATFLVPIGTTAIQFEVVPGSGPEGGAGFLDVVIADPIGEETRFGQQTTPGQVPPPAEEPEDPAGVEIEDPLAGTWTIHAEAIGPAAMRTYTIAMFAEGESEVVPTTLAITPTCS